VSGFCKAALGMGEHGCELLPSLLVVLLVFSSRLCNMLGLGCSRLIGVEFNDDVDV
jgi:hypothetical protein